MTLHAIAALIPDEYRKEILEMNMIDTAIAVGTDATMHYLGVIWKNYVEADFTPDCNMCLARVLNNMKQLKPVLVQMEKDSKLLKDL